MEKVRFRTKVKWYFWRTVLVLVWMFVFFGIGGALERIV
jgi:hypothetical protein